MDFLAKLRKAMGLPDDADEAAILAKVGKMGTSTQAAVDTALKPIAQAAGLKDGASATEVLAGVEALNGLLLIGWSASYTYIAMERFWTEVSVSYRE